MNRVNKTLYIPLYGKSYVSKKGIILSDKKAEEIWATEGFELKGKSKTKWLAYYMGIRSAVFDDWLREQMNMYEDAVIIHIGCGMDSRVERVGVNGHSWFDVDFPQVIEERRKYYSDSDLYHMLEGNAKDKTWLENIPNKKHAIVIMEGISMYLKQEELQSVMKNLEDHFEEVTLLMDCYTEFAAKASKYKNPINDVGVTQVYGIDNPRVVESNVIKYVREHEMTPQKFIDELVGMEKFIFQKLYAGNISKKLYKLYEFETLR